MTYPTFLLPEYFIECGEKGLKQVPENKTSLSRKGNLLPFL